MHPRTNRHRIRLLMTGSACCPILVVISCYCDEVARFLTEAAIDEKSLPIDTQKYRVQILSAHVNYFLTTFFSETLLRPHIGLAKG